MATKRKPKGEPQRIGEYSESKHDHECLGVHAVRDGTILKWAYDLDHRWDRYQVWAETPGPDKLFNFDVTLGKLGKLLVLDNYGDEVMPDELRKPLLNTEMVRETIGIFRKTGEVVRVAFIREKIELPAPGAETWKYSLTFWSFDKRVFVPRAYMKRLDELTSKKRPFYISLWESTLYGFITRWASYADLQASLLFDFHFNGKRLQLWSGSYREVADWTISDNPNDPERDQ